jgi:hypothetical protein
MIGSSEKANLECEEDFGERPAVGTRVTSAGLTVAAARSAGGKARKKQFRFFGDSLSF